MTDHVTLEMARTTIIALVALLRQARPVLTSLDVEPDQSQPVAVQLEQVLNGLTMKACALTEEKRQAEEQRETLHALKQRIRYVENAQKDPATLLESLAWSLNDSGIFRGLAYAVCVRSEDDLDIDNPTLCFMDGEQQPIALSDAAPRFSLDRQLVALRNMLDDDARQRIAAAEAAARAAQGGVKLAQEHARSLSVELDRQIAENGALSERLETRRGVNANLEREILSMKDEVARLRAERGAEACEGCHGVGENAVGRSCEVCRGTGRGPVNSADDDRIKRLETKLRRGVEIYDKKHIEWEEAIEKLKIAEDENRRLKLENEELSEQNARQASRVAEARAGEERAAAEVDDLRRELQRKVEELSNVTKDRDAERERSNKAIADRDFARRELTAANADLDRYMARCERLQASQVVVNQDCPFFPTTSGEDVSIFREQQAKKMAAASTAEAEREELAREAKALRVDMKELTQELRRVEADRDFVQRELKDSSADLDRVGALNEELQAENAKLKAMIESSTATANSALGMLDAVAEREPSRLDHVLNAALVHKQIGPLVVALAAVEDLGAAQLFRLAQHESDERWREMSREKLIELAVDAATRAKVVAQRVDMDPALAAAETRRRLADAANFLSFALATK